MDQANFVKGIQEILEIEDIEILIDTPLNITSLGILSLMVYIDENFNKRCKTSDLSKVECLRDLMQLIGKEHFI